MHDWRNHRTMDFAEFGSHLPDGDDDEFGGLQPEPRVLPLDGVLPQSGRVRDDEPRGVRRASVQMVLEPQSGPWTGNARWGSIRPVPAEPAEGLVVEVGAIDSLPGPPTERILQGFYRSTSDVVEGQPEWLLRAIVQLGTGALFQTLEFDWPFSGFQVPLIFDTARVFARIERSNLDAVSFNAPLFSFQLGYAVGRRGSSPAKAHTWTSGLKNVQAEIGTPLDVAVPAMARRVYPLLGPNAGVDSIHLRIRNYDLGAVMVDKTVTESVLLQGMPVPGWATNVQLERTGGDGDCFAGLMFELGL